MSGGSVGTVGIGVAATGVGMVAVAGYAAGAACAAVLNGTTAALQRHLDRVDAQRAAAAESALGWDVLIGDVNAINARIALLAATDGSAAALPTPLTLGHQTPADLAAWCRSAQASLVEAERLVVEHLVRSTLDRSWAVPTATGLEVVRHAAEPRTLAWDPGTLRDEVERLLSRLVPGVAAADHDEIVAAASRVWQTTTRGDGRARVDDVRHRVEAAIAAARRRRRDAEEAGAWLQPLRFVDGGEVRAELEQVVAGHRTLDEDLRRRTREAVTALRDRADDRYVVSSVQETLAELGFAPRPLETAVPRDGLLEIAHSDWTAHGVRLLVDPPSREVRAVVLRTGTTGAWDEALVDEQREAQWCAALPQLVQRLAAKGVVYTVVDTTPGVRATAQVRQARDERRGINREQNRAR